MSDEETTYGLVMPFTVCASNGGPYDDASFVAGVWFGKLDAELRWCVETGTDPKLDFPVPTPLVPQLDLLAMNHGLTMTSEPWDEAPDEHTFVTFAFPDPEDDS